MTNERELLKLAAKAMGKVLEEYEGVTFLDGVPWCRQCQSYPLTQDIVQSAKPWTLRRSCEQ